MATKSQLESALINADKAGDIAAAKALANALKSGSYDTEKSIINSAVDFVAESVSGNERATPQTESLPEFPSGGLMSDQSLAKRIVLAPALMTATNPDEIVKIMTTNNPNIGVAYNKDAQGGVYPVLRNNETGAVSQVNKPGMSALDVMQGLGIAAAFTPAGRAGTVVSAIGKNAATEAAIQGVQSLSGGDFDKADIALSAGIGGGLKGLENTLGAAGRTIKGTKENSLVDAGADAGIPLLTSDILQPKNFVGKTAQQTAEKIPFAGTGSVREGQQAKRLQAVADISEKYGQFSYSEVVNSLRSKKDKIKNAAGGVLQATGEKLDSIGVIPVTRTTSAIQEVSEELLKPGVIKSGSAFEDLVKLADAIKEAPQSFTTLKLNRTAFRDIIAGADKADRSQVISRAKSLLQKVERAITVDMKTFAKENLTDKQYGSWNKANAIYYQEFNLLKKSKLKSILDKGDVTPESVEQMLFSKKSSEVDLLYKSLSSTGRSNARAAIISKAVSNISKRLDGITPNSFATEMNKLGMQTNKFFKGEEKKQLTGLLKVLNATRRAQDSSVTTTTGQQLLGAGTLAALATDLGSTVGLGGTIGGFARIYESSPVRNALLRLGSIPKGSTLFEKALSEAQIAINAASQSARSLESE